MFGTYSQYQRLITDYYGSKNQVIIVEKLENAKTRTIQMVAPTERIEQSRHFKLYQNLVNVVSE